MESLDLPLSDAVKVLYSDGSVIKRNPSNIGGTWAYCGVDAEGYGEGNRILTFVGGKLRPGTTNNETELIAAVLALRAMPAGWSGILRSDSEVTLSRLARKGQGQGLSETQTKWVAFALARVNRVELQYVAGHPTKKHLLVGVNDKGQPVSPHNLWCDKECGRESARLYKEFLEKDSDHLIRDFLEVASP